MCAATLTMSQIILSALVFLLLHFIKQKDYILSNNFIFFVAIYFLSSKSDKPVSSTHSGEVEISNQLDSVLAVRPGQRPQPPTVISPGAPMSPNDKASPDFIGPIARPTYCFTPEQHSACATQFVR